MFRSSAHIYDLVQEAIGKDYAAESAELREQITSRNPSAHRLLDVACGTGSHLVHLRQWFEVAGVELDERMLAVARPKLPGVPLVHADMRTFDLQTKFDAVVCLFSSIGYLASTEELHGAVARMAAHLAPGGVLVVDGWLRPDEWIEPGVVHAASIRRDGIALARAGRSWREGRVAHLEIHHLVAELDGIDHLVDHHELTLFEPSNYVDAFTGAGLAVGVVASPMPGRDRYIGVAPA